MSTELYLNFIKDTLKAEGIQVADTANKIALKAERITTSQYSEAARLIADAFLKTI